VVPFKKGQSGNPGGRIGVPKEVRELARTHTEPAINRLAFWMQPDDPRASVAASNALLDRGYGKPVAQIEMDHHVNEFDGMTTEEELGEYILEQMSKLGIKFEKA
jgi:hypothetical protein